MHTLESVGRELQDLRGLVVGLERSLRRAERRNDGRKFIAMAAQAICHHLKAMDAVERWQQRAATGPAMTTVPGWASELTQSVVADFILSLGDRGYAAPGLFAAAHGHPLTAYGVAAVLSGEASASFVDEGQPIGVTKATFSSASFGAHSIKAISSFSEELAERSVPAVEELLRTILGRAVGSCLDSVLFGSAAASSAQPAGLLNGVTPTSGGATFAEDVAALMAVVKPAVPVFITGPGRRAALAADGSLLGFDYQVLASDAVADGRTVLVDADRMAVGFGGQPTFKVSREAVLVEQDQAGVVPFADGAGTVGAPSRSLWQTNSAALKVVLPASWTVAANAVAYTEATP